MCPQKHIYLPGSSCIVTKLGVQRTDVYGIDAPKIPPFREGERALYTNMCQHHGYDYTSRKESSFRWTNVYRRPSEPMKWFVVESVVCNHINLFFAGVNKDIIIWGKTNNRTRIYIPGIIVYFPKWSCFSLKQIHHCQLSYHITCNYLSRIEKSARVHVWSWMSTRGNTGKNTHKETGKQYSKLGLNMPSEDTMFFFVLGSTRIHTLHVWDYQKLHTWYLST